MRCMIHIVLLCLSTVSARAQRVYAEVFMDTVSPNPEEIVFRKGQLLALSDFQGEFEEGSNAIAMAYSGFYLRYDVMMKNKDVFLSIHLYPSFDKQRSWCLEAHRNARTLSHEQKHFDITIVNTCALYRALKSYPFTEKFQEEIEKLREQFREKNDKDQDIYDRETNHGINVEKQNEWVLKMNRELDSAQDCYW